MRVFPHMPRLPIIVAFLFSVVASCCAKPPPPAPQNFEVRRDAAYADSANPKQMLDLYLPKAHSDKPRAMVVFIHGGGWEGGDKNDEFMGMVFALIRNSEFAAASVNYRLTAEAKWPAQIHDCKAAIRWLRASAKELNIDPEKIGVVGVSAGGHLVSLLGTSGGVKELEGALGTHLDQSSRVQAVVDICGPSNFLTLTGHPSIIKFDEADSCTGRLFGKAIPEVKDIARAASPVTYISGGTPPFLVVHGTKDALVPFDQATEFCAALKKAGVANALITGKGGGHVFVVPEVFMRERLFLEKWLLGKDSPAAMEDKTVEIAPE